MKTRAQESTPSPAGWAIGDWCWASGIGRTFYYGLPENFRPRAVRIGDRVIITEQPAAWLERMAALGGVPSLSHATANPERKAPAKPTRVLKSRQR